MYTIQTSLDGDSFVTIERGPVPFKELKESDLFYSREDVVAEASAAQCESYEITGCSEITVKVYILTKTLGSLVPVGEIKNFEDEFLRNIKVLGFESNVHSPIAL